MSEFARWAVLVLLAALALYLLGFRLPSFRRSLEDKPTGLYSFRFLQVLQVDGDNAVIVAGWRGERTYTETGTYILGPFARIITKVRLGTENLVIQGRSFISSDGFPVTLSWEVLYRVTAAADAYRRGRSGAVLLQSAIDAMERTVGGLSLQDIHNKRNESVSAMQDGCKAALNERSAKNRWGIEVDEMPIFQLEYDLKNVRTSYEVAANLAQTIATAEQQTRVHQARLDAEEEVALEHGRLNSLNARRPRIEAEQSQLNLVQSNELRRRLRQEAVALMVLAKQGTIDAENRRKMESAMQETLNVLLQIASAPNGAAVLAHTERVQLYTSLAEVGKNIHLNISHLSSNSELGLFAQVLADILGAFRHQAPAVAKS